MKEKNTRPNELIEECQFAMRLCHLAEKKILPYFRQSVQIQYKSDETPVTIADKGAEEAIRNEIIKQCPTDGIIGEEFGQQVGQTSRQWVIDPIDGTKAFIIGAPLFGTLIALLENGVPILGVIHLPALQSTLYASRGNGCFLDGHKATVSTISTISQATVLDGSITSMEKRGYEKPWKKIRHQARVARGWGDCYGYYLVATGKADVMVDPIAEIWDLSPMMVILEEAGGRFTSLTGKSDALVHRSGIGSNGFLHSYIVEQFAPYIN